MPWADLKVYLRPFSVMPATNSRRLRAEIPAPPNRGMTELDRSKFHLSLKRLGVRVDDRDVLKLIKSREMQRLVRA